MSTNSREAILQRIRTEVSKAPPIALPPVPEVWPRQTSDPVVLAERFISELQAVHGEVIQCKTMDDLQRQLAELISQTGWSTIGAMDRPICREAIAQLNSQSIQWPRADWPPREMADLSVGLIAAKLLLADTGSCLVACPTAEDRLLCYLPPACVVIAKVDQLVEHMPAAWETVAPRCAQRELSGEFVIITGPSRTSDIEKTLILGAHGPKRLVVMLLG